MTNTMKPCVRCGVTRPVQDFYRQHNTKDQRRGVCKLCQYTPKGKYRRSPKDAAYKLLYDSCKNSAKFRGLAFELTEQQHASLVVLPCTHCGTPPERYNPYLCAHYSRVSESRKAEAWIVKNGLDRVDNSFGYSMENCVPSCSQCNYGRQDYSVKEYYEHCERVVKHRGKFCG